MTVKIEEIKITRKWFTIWLMYVNESDDFVNEMRNIVKRCDDLGFRDDLNE